MFGYRVSAIVISSLCILIAWLWAKAPSRGQPNTVDRNVQFNWTEISPTRDLQYHQCWLRFQCARLELPLDWNNTGRSNDNVAIAIVRLPAKVPVTDPRYAGAVFVDPGGPGFSGVRAGLVLGPALQTIVGAPSTYKTQSLVPSSPEAKYYDILSFDPRGLNNSTPYLSCHNKKSSEVAWSLKGNDHIIGTPEADALYVLARAKARGDGCSTSDVHIANFMSTASVARDVVEIAERHGEWRAAQSRGQALEVVERLAWRPGEETINYWGLSYGTIVGQTLASMQPHRVGRFLLDGVNEAEDYFSGHWRHNIVDADKVFANIFQTCADAGVESCALWSGPSGNDTAARVKEILDSIKRNGPVPVPGNDKRDPQLITLSDVTNLLVASTMLPRKYWFLVAGLIQPLLSGDGSMFAAMKDLQHPLWEVGSAISDELIDPFESSRRVPYMVYGRPGMAVRCGDTRLSRSKDEFFEYWEHLRGQSVWMADWMATQQADCFGWAARPNWNYADQHKIASNVTANPILFASSSLDPITPLAYAKTVQALFKGSNLLEVDGAGHTTISLVNLCAAKEMRRHFQAKDLPEGELRTCAAEKSLGGFKRERKLDQEGEVLLEAIEEIHNGWT